ncbi:hypothetical protein [Streptomyces sp. NBC_01538]|uniref:hypothetical protein n=1 Tax=Streptomyces sp. NBC_01538 TaxID=2903897 RepID=UPI0038648D62
MTRGEGQTDDRAAAVAFWWSAGFFAAGALITFLLYRPGVPVQDENDAPVVHM